MVVLESANYPPLSPLSDTFLSDRERKFPLYPPYLCLSMIPLSLAMAQCGLETPQTASQGVEVKGQIFEVGPRYYDLNYIGEGAYGMVW